MGDLHRPSALKLQRAYFWSVSLLQKEQIVEKWDWDQQWARISFMVPGPG